jgi:esterase/lipase superfamily enzyme
MSDRYWSWGPFGQVILAAPDVDHDTYRDMVGEIADTVEHVTLYGSTNDQAIRLSKAFHSYPRAGDGGQGIPVVPRSDKRVDAIDASAIPADLMGHAYLETKDILKDMQAVTEQQVSTAGSLDAVGESRGGILGLQSIGTTVRRSSF